MSNYQISKDLVKSRLEFNIDSVARYLIPNGKRQGYEWVAGDIDGSNGDSLKVHLAGDKAGIWCDFATGEKGDILELWMKVKGLDFHGALKDAAAFAGIIPNTLNASNSKQSKSSNTISEIKEQEEKSEKQKLEEKLSQFKTAREYLLSLPTPTCRPPEEYFYGGKFYIPTVIYTYVTDRFYRYRIYLPDEKGSEKKLILPLCWDGKNWVNCEPPHKVFFFYRIELIESYRQALQKNHTTPEKKLIVVEGEKAADAAVSLFPNDLVTTTYGGSSRTHNNDFSPVKDLNVYIWPDNDDVGIKYASNVARLALVNGANDVYILNIKMFGKYRKTENKKIPDKWDAADAVDDSISSENTSELMCNEEFLVSYRKCIDDLQNRIKKVANQFSVTEDSFNKLFNKSMFVKSNLNKSNGEQDLPTIVDDYLKIMLNQENITANSFDVIEEGIDKLVKESILNNDLKVKATIKCNVLKDLLKEIKRINIDRIAVSMGATPDSRTGTIKVKEKLVVIVEQLLMIAKFKSKGLCRNLDFLYLYDGTFWECIDMEELKTFLGVASQKFGLEPIIANHHEIRSNLLKQFESAAHLSKPEKPKGKVLVNLSNGTLTVTKNGATLQPFNRDDFLTYKLPFNYDPNAQAPLFEKYLNKVVPDFDKQRVLAEFLGYVFINTDTLNLEKALILFGSGANGKSVFFQIVQALFGTQNTSEYSLQSLTNETGYYRAMIANKLVNYASEINGKLEASRFKQLVAGEPIEVRLPYGDPHIIRDYAKFIFNCNELPTDVEHTEAYFRRFLIIHFDITIPEEEQDKQLASKIIQSELPGILNWVLNGLDRLLQQKRFSECESANQALKQYRYESDNVSIFIEDGGYKASTKENVPMKTFYSEYRNFCVEHGYKPVKHLNFKKRISKFNILVEKKNTCDVAYVYRIASN